MELIDAGERGLIQEMAHPAFEAAGVRVLVQREDLVDEAVGGNKRLKLVHNVARAREVAAEGIVTFGGHLSNHLVATAAAAARAGLKSIGYVRDRSDSPTQFTKLAQANGMSMRFVSTGWFRRDRSESFLDELAARHPGYLVLPEGASNRLGVRGVAEFASKLPAADIVCVPCGTGGTVAGLVAGLAGRGQVWGVAAWRGQDALEADISRMLKESDIPWRNFEILHGHHCGGFGVITPALKTLLIEFGQQQRLSLDSRFTGKMFAALVARAGTLHLPPGTTVLAIHTGLGVTRGVDRERWAAA